MKLPAGESAIVDTAKLRDYCLNVAHPVGGHKARVFKAALGFGPEHAELLRSQLLAAARDADASPGRADGYGQRYVIDFLCEGVGRRATVRSGWMIRRSERVPRLTSCYVR
jgi:hypothetical protein